MKQDISKKIAVVGLGCFFADAPNITQFWKNILEKKVSIRPLPDEILKPDIYYRPELLRETYKQDKTYTNVAGWIEDIKFDVRKYKIPPAVAQHMESNQHAALYTTDQALTGFDWSKVSKERISVIMGNGMVGDRYFNSTTRVNFQHFEHTLKHNPLFTERFSKQEQENILEYLKDICLKGTIPITEDSAPGILPNLVAGRVANVFDFHGPAYTVDTACASGLAAIISGIDSLNMNKCDLAIAGASDMSMLALGFIWFSAINALSPNGSFPFDSRADGFVIGQGAGTVLLKRLSDAVRDKDHIYAVITGYSQTSDGKGKYIAAPNEEWQSQTIQQACRMAGYPIDTVELIETHGTATAVGDVVEVSALKKSFSALGCSRKNYCGIGSVKSNIGHLKSAAGLPGFIKAVLALEHKILPPTANFKQLNPKLQLEDSPFYVVTDPKPWEAKEHPRRANVSSFGFGGANSHVTLQEYRADDYEEISTTYQKQDKGITISSNPLPENKTNSNSYTFFFSGDSLEELNQNVANFFDKFSQKSQISFAQSAFLHNSSINARKKIRLAILASSYQTLQSKFAFFTKNSQNIVELEKEDIFLKQGDYRKSEQIAAMFPGQASQYPNMLKNLQEAYPSLSSIYSQIDAFWTARRNYSVSSLVFSQEPEEKALEILKDTSHAHPAIFASNFSSYRLLQEMGFSARYMIGHSLGEVCALAAGGMLSFSDAMTLIESRGFAFKDAKLADFGRMLAVRGELKHIQDLVKESNLEVGIANINSLKQIIVSGSSEQIQKFAEFLKSKRISHTPLYVSHAFHSNLMKPVADLFYQRIQNLEFSPSLNKIIANQTASYYSNENLSQIATMLKEQIYQPVNFVASIQKLYEDGVRLFVEVGPNSILSNLVKDILNHSDVSILTLNTKGKNDFECFQRFLAGLFVQGIQLQLAPSRMQIPQNSEMPALEITNVETKQNKNIGTSKVESPTVQKNIAISDVAPKIEVKHQEFSQEKIVYSGVSIGLPGSFKKSFRDDNFEQIFEGRNFIERLTDAEKQKLVDLNITKLVKSSVDNPAFKLLSSLNEVIQLAGKIGKIDLLADYHISEKEIRKMTSTIGYGVAAGYEALCDAGIPLIRENIITSTGNKLPTHRWLLPAEMQHETGIIFANGFPMIEPFIQEVSRYVAYKYGSKLRQDLIGFYEQIIDKVTDPNIKKLLSDWYTLHYSRLTHSPGEAEVYQFNHHFMDQVAVQANNHLASMIGAKGINFQLNAACSSTVCAITLAESLIKTGKMKRMIIIGADDASSSTNLPWLGAGFLCTGAAANAEDLYECAVPFDRRRNGMLMGAGAVGIVIETDAEVKKRGMVGVCELLGSHSFNTTRHPAQIDKEAFAEELNYFMSKMEQEHHLNRDTIAPKMVYLSHETYTPPRGGCAQTEAHSLRTAFTKSYQKILISNTKGMTGHLMGPSIEDAVAAKCLQFQKVPPVVNCTQPDPEFNDLALSKGGAYSHDYVLRMAAGFGAQGNFVLLKKIASGKDRILDSEKHKKWLQDISGKSNPKVEMRGRILIIQETQGSYAETSKTLIEKMPAQVQTTTQVQTTATISPSTKIVVSSDIINLKENLTKEILQVFSQITQYPPEMLDLNMEMEADLGIDTVKQATVLSMLAEKFGFSKNERIPLAEYPTIGHIVNLISQKTQKVNTIEVIEKSKPVEKTVSLQSEQHSSKQKFETVQTDKQKITQEVLQVFSQVTQYPPEMLDLNMEMEADLGIDTVKQATVLSMLAEKFGFSKNERIPLAEYPTIGHIVNLISQKTQKNDTSQRIILSPPVEKKAELPPAISESPKVGEHELSRQIVVLHQENLGKKVFDLAGKHILVLGDNASFVKKIAEEFAKKQNQVETFVFAENTEKTNTSLQQFSAKAIDVIVDCSHIGDAYNFYTLALQEAKELLLRNSEARFLFYKNLEAVGKKPQVIVCCVAMDGHLGYASDKVQITDPSFGALSGFYKSLRKEWKESRVKIVDFAPDDILQHFGQYFANLVEEIEKEGFGIEISYSNNQRWVAKIQDQSLEAKTSISFNSTDTILVTGGATGITSQIVLGIARKYPANLVILGRTHLPENIEELVQLDEKGLANLKLKLPNELERNNVKVTPAIVNQAYNKILKAIEVQRTLEAIRKFGRKVLYYACDIRDYESMKLAIQTAKQTFGNIHAIIHAAGIDNSHYMGQKTLQEFNNVFSTKAVSACYLMEICREEPLKLVAAFGSISGRFGSEAQLDYSSANNFLSYWTKLYHTQFPNIHAFTLVWSGWKDTGIAWRNTLVREHAEEQAGFNLIAPVQGVAAFLEEFGYRNNDMEIILHNGLSIMSEKDLMVVSLENAPFLDRVICKNNKVIRAYKTLSVKKDAFMDQHRLGTTPISPAVASTEMCVEYYTLQEGYSEQYFLENVSFLNAVKLYHEQPREIYFEGEKIADEKWKVVLKSKFYPKNQQTPQIITHVEATISKKLPDLFNIHPTEWSFTKKTRKILSVKKVLFNESGIHVGPLYRYTDSNYAGEPAKEFCLEYNSEGMVYPTLLPPDQLTHKQYPISRLCVNPCFLDIIYQIGATYIGIAKQKVGLPVKAKELSIIKVPRERGEYICHAQILKEDEEYLTYNVSVSDSKGQLYYYGKELTLQRIH